MKLPDESGPTISDQTKQHCCNKRSMITPEAWTPVIINSQCSSIKWIERSTKYILPRIQVCMYVCKMIFGHVRRKSFFSYLGIYFIWPESLGIIYFLLIISWWKTLTLTLTLFFSFSPPILRQKPSKPNDREILSTTLKCVITEKANIGHNDEEVIHHRNSPFFSACLLKAELTTLMHCMVYSLYHQVKEIMKSTILCLPA